MYQQLSLLGKKIKAAWGQIFDGEASTELQNNIAEKVNSNTNKETYSFTYLFTKIREWLDEAIFDTGKTYEYVVKNKKFQEGFDIDNDYMEDIKADSILNADLKKKISSIGSDFVDHKDELLNDALEAGETGLAFDETEFFANTRPNIPNSSVLDNIYTGTGVTLAQMEADVRGARTQLKGFKIKDKPVNKNAQIIIVCPTQLTDNFNVIRDSETINLGSGAITNTVKGTFDIVENYDQDTTNNDWYVINKNSKMKPLILQERENVSFKEIPDDLKDLTLMNWKARYAVGYGNPLSIIKVDNA